MSKQLITVDNLADFVCLDSSVISLDPARYIVSPGAKDELARRKIELVYDSAAGCSGKAKVDDFVIAVAAVLKQEYGINDPVKLRDTTLSIVKTIKESI